MTSWIILAVYVLGVILTYWSVSNSFEKNPDPKRDHKDDAPAAMIISALWPLAWTLRIVMIDIGDPESRFRRCARRVLTGKETA